VSLTNREKEVLDSLIKGHGNKEIAKELHIRPRTVKAHLKRIAFRMGINTPIRRIGLAVEWYYRLNPEKRI
jgi:DNA-binding NarL/FixJ family response regulator